MADDVFPDKKNDPMAAATSPMAGVVSGDPQGADEPMTDKQSAELRQLCDAKGEPFDGNLTAAQASERIEALKAM